MTPKDGVRIDAQMEKELRKIVREKIGPFASPDYIQVSADQMELDSDILFLKHDRSILRQSSNPICGFSMMGQVRLCAVWPTGNWLGSSMNHIQGWMTA